jgi:hypothetical protein
MSLGSRQRAPQLVAGARGRQQCGIPKQLVRDNATFAAQPARPVARSSATNRAAFAGWPTAM